MRLAPIFLVLLVCVWLGVAALAWAIAGAFARREPRLRSFTAAVIAAAAGVALLIWLGPRNGVSLLLSLPLVALLALFAGWVL